MGLLIDEEVFSKSTLSRYAAPPTVLKETCAVPGVVEGVSEAVQVKVYWVQVEVSFGV